MTYVIYAQGYRPPDQHPRMYVPVFSHLSQATAWLGKMINGAVNKLDHDIIRFTAGDNQIELRSDRWDEILDAHAPEGQCPPDHANNILRFKYGTWDEVHEKPEPEDDKPSAPRPERSARAQRPDGYVSITELCDASNILPSDARSILRAHMTKPEYGWAFSPEQLPSIRKLIGA